MSLKKRLMEDLKTSMKNKDKIKGAIDEGKIKAIYNSNLLKIEESIVTIKVDDEEEPLMLENDLVYIFAGGELPTQFLKNAGITITKKFGEAILKHDK